MRVEPVPGELGVLTELASVVATAWEQVDRISNRSVSRPEGGPRHRNGTDRAARHDDGIKTVINLQARLAAGAHACLARTSRHTTLVDVIRAA